MSGDRKLELNSLSRYRKISRTLLLEEHSHCEVPAGCGGVVVRWIDPREGLPITLRTYAHSKVHVFLDGAPLESARPTVPRGTHVLAIHVERGAPTTGVMVSAAYEEPGRVRTAEQRRSTRSAPAFVMISEPDGEWVGTNVEPTSEGWKREGFELSNTWRSLVEVAIPTPGRDAPGHWTFRELAAFKPVAIGLANQSEPLWIRRVFTLENDEEERVESAP